MEIKKKNGKIAETDWHKTVDSNPFIISLREFENLSFDIYDYAILKIGNKIYGRLLWDWETQKVVIEMQVKHLPKIYKELERIAADLGCRLFINKNDLFDPNKHLPIPSVKINRDKRFFESNDFDFIRWIAVRGTDRKAIMKELCLRELKEVNIENGVEGNEIIITPDYHGWTFILGNNLSRVLIKDGNWTSEVALEKLCNTIQSLSKKFVEIQYFEHQGKSNITGYFKANNGKFIFGYWKSEIEEFKKGKIPNEIKNIHPSTAHEISSIWSIDPIDFVFIEKMVTNPSILAVLESK